MYIGLTKPVGGFLHHISQSAVLCDKEAILYRSVELQAALHKVDLVTPESKDKECLMPKSF